jgi:hypothetical protein
LTKIAADRLASIDDSRQFGAQFAICAAIDPFFLGPIYHLFSGEGRNGGRNQIGDSHVHFDHFPPNP